MYRTSFKVKQTLKIKQTCTHLYVLLMNNNCGYQTIAEEVLTTLLENTNPTNLGHVA